MCIIPPKFTLCKKGFHAQFLWLFMKRLLSYNDKMYEVHVHFQLQELRINGNQKGTIHLFLSYKIIVFKCLRISSTSRMFWYDKVHI